MSTPSPEAASLGEPSYVWRFGQERRLDLIRRHVSLEEKRFLDVGCGIGTYVKRVREIAALSAGIDISEKRLQQSTVRNLVCAVSERLPFRSASFDVILLNEVIEHVRDDRETLRECLRAVRPGGHVVIYAPNRLYPFETHGIYLGKRYRFGNIPLVNYLPRSLRDRLVPHAKAYTSRDIGRLLAGLPARTMVRTYVYPGFDNVVARRPRLGKWLRRVLYRAEENGWRRFGLSHFVILQRLAEPSASPLADAVQPR